MDAVADSLGSWGLLDDEAIRLDEAGLALSAADDANADLDLAREIYDSMLRRLADRGAHLSGPLQQARLLSLVVATEEGFRGDSQTYDAPENADWLSMFRRRRALPITLAMLYVSLARRLGWEAQVLGLPGHVLVRVGRDPASVLLDGFESGALLGAAAIHDIVTRALGRHARVEPQHVAALSNRATLVRLLSNPATRARRAGDVPRALVLTKRMTQVAPESTMLWWERARLEQLTGDVAAARRSLAAMRETTRNPEITRRIDAAWEALTR